MTYGLIGLGKMGWAMAERWLNAGHKLVVYNRTREKTKRLVEKYPDRVILAESPREVAHRAQYILSMVADDQAIQTIAGDDEEDHGLLSVLGGQTYLGGFWYHQPQDQPKSLEAGLGEKRCAVGGSGFRQRGCSQGR